MSDVSVCSKCKKEKPLSDFYWRNDRGKYRRDCKKCVIVYPKRKQERDKKYYSKNRENILSKSKKYYSENKKKIAEKNKTWRKNNPKRTRELARKGRSKRRAIQKGVTVGNVSNLTILLCKQNGMCANCKIKGEGVKFHIDHIVPLSNNGLHCNSNIQVLCQECNMSKGNKDPVQWARENGRLL